MPLTKVTYRRTPHGGRRLKPFKKVDAARPRYLLTREAKRLINSADAEFRPLVHAALETGARYSELARLRVYDFDPDGDTVHIRESKSGKARHVELTDEGAKFFRGITAGRLGAEVMFRRADGSPWRASQQARPMADAVKRAKISPPITFHGLRHTWASIAIMNGVPMMVVAQNLGHANTLMAEKHYAHLANSFVKAAIKAERPALRRGQEEQRPQHLKAGHSLGKPAKFRANEKTLPRRSFLGLVPVAPRLRRKVD